MRQLIINISVVRVAVLCVYVPLSVACLSIYLCLSDEHFLRCRKLNEGTNGKCRLLDFAIDASFKIISH